MVNTVTLIGRLTKNPEVQQTQGGNSVCQFTLAVNRSKPDAPTDFIQCVAWNKTAETLCQYMAKGSLIGVVGRIQTRTYENKQGQTIYITEVLTNQIAFLESKKESNKQPQYSQPQPRQDVVYTSQENSYIDIDNDDLPF